MEVTHDCYFWLKKSNTILTTYAEYDEKIILNKEDSIKLELGLIVPLIKLVYSGQLPNESEFAIANSSNSRLYNWNMLLKPLENIGVIVNADTKALIVAGDRQQVIDIINSIIDLIDKNKKKKKIVNTSDGALLLNNIEANSALEDAESVLEFLILTFCKAFHITPKIAAGLLTQKCHYLSQIIVKGLKSDYSPVFEWYEIMQNHLSSIIALIETEQSSLNLIYSCLKPGLLSKNLSINIKAAEIINLYYTQLRVLESLSWDWFYTQSDAIILCFKLIDLNQESFFPYLNLLLTFGKKKLADVFYSKLKDFCKNWKNYIKFIQIFLPVISKSPWAQLMFNQGLIDSWVDIGLRESETDIKNLDNKVFCIGFLCDLWGSFPNYIEIRDDLATNMLAVIKRSTREVSKLLKFIIYGRLFYLLSIFSLQKNSFAPVIYKTLTFFLIENYNDESIREFMLTNTIKIFTEIDSIPLGILLEPFIKQSQIAKNVIYNIFDFDFFIFIAKHSRLIIKDAILLIDLLGKIILSSSYYCLLSTVPFLLIINHFSDNVTLKEYLIKYIGISIRVYYSEKIKNENPIRNKLTQNILYLIEKIIQVDVFNLNQEIKEIFDQNYDELKKIKDNNLGILFRILGVVKKNEENFIRFEKSLAVDKNYYEDPGKVSSLYNVPRGRVMSDLEKVKKKRLERENKEKDEISKKNINEVNTKKHLRKQIEKRRIELGVKSKIDEEDTVFLSETTDKEMIIQLNRIQEESLQDQDMIDITIKKYSRVIRILFAKYTGSSYKHKVNPVCTFDKLQDTKANLSESDFCKLIRENNISSLLISTEEIRQIFKSLALKIKSSTIQFENFNDLLYMTSSLIFTRDPFNLSKYPQAIIFDAIFEMFKETEPQIVPKYIYEETDPGYGDRDIVRILNQELEKNPEIPMPETYKKYKEAVLCINHNAIIDNVGLKISLEILDSIMVNCFAVHLLMPIVDIEYKYRAKGLCTTDDNKPSIKNITRIESNPKFSKLSPYAKLSAIKSINIPEEDIIECAKLLDDIIYSVSKNSMVLISKFPKPAGSINNKIIIEKQTKEIERNIEIEKAELKRKNRMQTIEEEVNRLREQKEYKIYLEEEEKKKESLKAKFFEKKMKVKRDKEKFELEERLLEYKLGKYEKEIKAKEKSDRFLKDMWRMGRVNASIDYRRPKSIEVSLIEKETNRNKSISIPVIKKKNNK